MRIYTLTQTGLAIASAPSDDQSDAHRLLAWIRRRGWSASDEQIKNFFGGDGLKARIAVNRCTRSDSEHTPALIERVQR